MIEFVIRSKLFQIYWLGFSGALLDFRVTKIQDGATVTFQLMKMHFSVNILPKIRQNARRKNAKNVKYNLG